MNNLGFDLSQYYLLIVSFFGLLVIPQLVGLLVGTLLLDEKDQDTLTALMVTPMPVRTYAIYRALTPALISVLGILLVVPFINVLVLPVEKLLPLAVAAAPLGTWDLHQRSGRRADRRRCSDHRRGRQKPDQLRS